MTLARTMLAKIWEEHIVERGVDGAPDLLYVDLHLIHEVTSPQAFEALRLAGREVRRPDLTFAVEDHNVPTDGLGLASATKEAIKQIKALRDNTAATRVRLARMGDADQGIVHVVGPELGLSQPGCLVVCGDSHTTTHGALGCLAFGIGTSEVEHVLATQTLRAARPLAMKVTIEGRVPPGVSPKDLALYVVHRLGTAGGQGCAIEYQGSAVAALSMEGRMTLCNLSIEAGARAAMVAPDEVTFDYLRGRKHAPDQNMWDVALSYWTSLRTDAGASYDRNVTIDVGQLSPFVTWGTNPAQSSPISGLVPDPSAMDDATERAAAELALEYMDLVPGQRFDSISVDKVFVGSCTNSRIEDLEEVASVLRGKQVAPGLQLMVVPGSAAVRADAERRGIDRVITEAGGLWRQAGCSMCVAMNADAASPKERVASTSNRNFEGRQGIGVRTHLVSPAVAAATAIAGHLAAPIDCREGSGS